jgi:hypothetical protein
MEDVILSYDDKNIDFSNIGLCTPSSIHGGSYFTKIQYCKKPLYMQSPKCTSKQGIIHSGKKVYIDLVFTSEKDGDFISFLENLEKKCIDIIYEKRHMWFTDDLEKTDIETAFASMVKSYKKVSDLNYEIIITDYYNDLIINYSGLLPPMFREKQGVVAQGQIAEQDTSNTKPKIISFTAKELITKHDEKYMPPEIERSLKKD